MLTGRGIKSCINRPKTHWKRRSEWQRGIIPIRTNFQWLCFSVERSERHHQIQDTIPSTMENQQLADNLNEFYFRFEKTLWTPLHTTINTSSNPPLPQTCNSDQQRRGASGLPEAEKEKITRPRLLHHPVWNPALNSWPQRSVLQTLHYHPHPKLQD